MERLTVRDSRRHAWFNNDGVLIRGANGTFHQKKDMTTHYIHDRFVALDKVIDQLASYEDIGMEPEEVVALRASFEALRDEAVPLLQAKIEDRLAVLPCNVGDTIYVISYGRIVDTKVRTFFFGHPSHRIEDGKMRMIRTTDWDIPMDEIGKRIFLTREEAEVALAERKECQK